MRIVPFILYLLLIAFYQVVLYNPTAIHGITMNIAGLTVLFVALYKPELTATWFGFFAGIVLASGEPGQIGWQAASLAGLGLVAFHVREKLNLDSLLAKVLLVFIGIVIHNFLSWIIDPSLRQFALFLPFVLGGALYTTVISIFFFFIRDGLITRRKIQQLF